jgi:hypothetical protein
LERYSVYAPMRLLDLSITDLTDIAGPADIPGLIRIYLGPLYNS